MTTYRASILSLFIKKLIEDNSSVIIDGVNVRGNIELESIDEIFYGDQRILTGGVTICVEPTTKARDWVNTGSATQNDFETSIIIYVDGDSGVENIQLAADQLLEEIEDLINKRATPVSAGFGGDQMGGLITHGLAGASAEHGYRVPASQTIRANRLIFRSMSRTLVYEVI